MLAIIVLGASVIAGYALKDALTALGVASISALSLSVTIQVSIMRNLIGGPVVMYDTASVLPGQDIFSVVLSSFFFTVFGGYIAFASTQTMLAKGTLLKRGLAFWSPIVTAIDEHPWIMTLLGIIATFIITLYFSRR
jgi:hypothetical protein